MTPDLATALKLLLKELEGIHDVLPDDPKDVYNMGRRDGIARAIGAVSRKAREWTA